MYLSAKVFLSRTGQKHVIKEFFGEAVPGEADRERAFLLRLQELRGIPLVCTCRDPANVVMSYQGHSLMWTTACYRILFPQALRIFMAYIAAEGVSLAF